MKVLVIGSGGREHALAWKLANSPSVDEVISAPGNPGMAALGETVQIEVGDINALADLAVQKAVDLTVVGPEIPLVAGIADLFEARSLVVFGPSKAAAEIEGSKVFCRDLALRHGVSVAQGESFDDPEAATRFARTIAPPIVVKASGLAAGKGVLICRTNQEAVEAIDTIMRDRAFGDSGDEVIVEEFLEGRETSLFCLCDGTTKLVLEPAQDYKRIFDDDGGPNTGGMGAYSPVPWLTPELRQRAIDEVVFPLIDGLAEEGRTYRGCFYAGLMFTEKGPYLIEVNCRFGDPETQILMPRLESDLGELLLAVATGTLHTQQPVWSAKAGVSVVVAAEGYPGDYATGRPITLPDTDDDVVIFHAGTTSQDGSLVSSGGRVLNVSALGDAISDARARAYEAVDAIQMEGKYARRDIAKGIQ